MIWYSIEPASREKLFSHSTKTVFFNLSFTICLCLFDPWKELVFKEEKFSAGCWLRWAKSGGNSDKKLLLLLKWLRHEAVISQESSELFWWHRTGLVWPTVISNIFLPVFLPFSNKKAIYNFLNTLTREYLVNDTYFDYLHLYMIHFRRVNEILYQRF